MKSFAKKTSTLFIFLTIITAFSVFSRNAEAAILEPGFEVETVASGLNLPTAMTFTSDGRIFIAEKGGAVKVIKNGALLPTPVITLTDVNTFGDRGLIGITADPNFSTNGFLYLSYTYENSPGSNFSGPKTGRVVRVTVVGDSASESSKVVILGTVGGTPALPSCDDYPVGTDCIPSDSMSHSVGGLRFGPDGTLYATFGDGSNFDVVDPRALRAQNLDNLAGKVIRINPDGTAPADNPFYNGDQNANRSKVYALGVRNAFRLNFRAQTGSLYVGDVGWSSWEEVNLVTPGSNFGWPCHEGMGTTTYNCTASSAVTNPLYTYAHDANGAGSVTVGSFSTNSAYPAEYNNSLFFGDYAQNWIKRLVIDESNTVVSVHNFIDNPDGPVDISTGPDGNIYYLSIYTGSLNRLTHTTGNRRPVPMIGATPTSGLIPLTVTFSSAGSMDPDSDPLAYSWNFGDGAISTLENPTHQYTVNGTYTATLTLTDSNGSSASKSITVSVGNQKPSPQIVSPASGTLYTANQTIQLNGAATDPEDGTLPASAYHWEVILHHNVHTHTIQQFDGVTNPSFMAPDHGASDVYTEITLTVTDSGGLSDTRSINLYFNNGGGSGNLIGNASLEVEDSIPGRPYGWFQGWYGNLNPVFSYPVSGFDGAKAAQLEINNYTSGDAKWYFAPVFVSPGQKYVFSDYYTANTTSRLSVQFGFSDGTYQYQNLGDVPPAAAPTYIEKQLLIPAGVQTVTIFHQLDRIGILTVDNFSLTLAPAPETIAPTVSITSPSNGSTVSTTTAISVDAADNVGVTGVTFFVDGATVGTEDTSAPYNFVWDTSTFSNGSHALSATARDAAGNVATSTSVTVTVSNTITNLISNGTMEIADGSKPLGWNSNSWGNHTAVHTYPVLGYNGQKAVRTEITSYPAGGTGDAKWYFNKVPVTPGTLYTYKDHYRSNTISDIIGQYTLQDGSFHYFGLVKEIPPNTTWQQITATFTPPPTASQVTFFHLISSVGFVEVDDVEMYATGTSTPSETNVPIVEFINPLAGQIVSGTVAITASSTDDTAVTYIFYAVDGIPVTGQITTPPYLFNWDSTTVTNGNHILKATTHDPSGNNSTHTITISVNNSATTTPPTSNLILNPSLETAGTNGDPANWFRGGWGTNNRTFTYPTAGIEGADAAKVEITAYTDGDAKWYFADVAVTGGNAYTFTHSYKSNVSTELIARYQTSTGIQYQFLEALPANLNWTTATRQITVPANATALSMFHVLHSVGVLETDNFSLTSNTADVTPPSVSVTSPSAGSTVSGTTTVSIAATDNVGVAGVSLLVDGATVGTEDTSAPYNFVWDTSTFSNGSHALSASARDAAGNIATSTAVSVTVSNGAPVNNLIANPSMETAGTGGNPQNWLRGGWGTNTRTFTYPVAGNGGGSAAKVEITSYTNGDAKWFFTDVPVTPGSIYTFTHSYRSNTSSNLTLRYTKADGTFQYVGLRNLSAALNWTNVSEIITVPAGVVSMTVFHSLLSVGWLELDSYSLTTGNTDTFARGMVSLTFDDGWLSHYTNALPILNAAAVKGTFFIVSEETLGAIPDERIANASLETVGTNGDPANWFRGGWGTNNRTFTYPAPGDGSGSAAKVEITSYTSGDAKWYFGDATVIPNQDYTISDRYNSTAGTETVLRYTRSDGTFQYAFLATLPSTGGTWQTFTQTITIPANVSTTTLFHVLPGVGSLTVDNYSLKRVQVYADPSQVLSMEAAGHEIAAHTRTHPDLTTLATAAQESEIVGSRNDLLGMGVSTVNTIAYPFGAYNGAIQTITQNGGFIAGRSVDRGYNVKTTDKYALKIQQINRTTTLAEVQAWVNQAAQDKTWLIFMFHQIDSNPLADLGATPAFLQEIVDYIKTANVDIVTMRQGVGLMNP